MNRRSRRADARKPQANSNAPGASTPAALYEAGLRYMRAERYLDAQVCCEQALAIDPNHAGTLHLMGLVSLQAEQYDHAAGWLARAIRQDPNPVYLLSLGTTLQRQGRRDEALQVFDKAVQLKPNDPELWRNLGNALIDLDRPDDAILTFQHVLKLDPQHADAAFRIGFLLHQLGRLEEALSYLNLSERLQPNDVPTLQVRGLSLRGLKRFDEALADSRRALALDPTNAETSNNIGALHESSGRQEEALQWYDKAIELRPNFSGAFNNKAYLLGQMHRFDEAFALYDHMKAIGLNDAVSEWNLSLLHMLTGNFEAGWAGREARWNSAVRSIAYPKIARPMWRGEESIEGRTILIHADEGFGDTLQFARYVPMVAALGARVILVVAAAAYPLLSGLPGVSQCFPKPADKLPDFDMHCPISSLPLAFGTKLDTIPSGISYLPAPGESRVQAWEDRLGSHDRLRVGLVWSGNPSHKNDHNRSIPLRALTRVLDVDVTFVSLQKDPRPADKATLLERPDIIDLTADLTDFSETAALVSCLDLVISVDTSVAHLAAALGRPTWILLPFAPDYRWLLDRDDSPWYPTMRLFRQTATREYASVLDRVRAELQTRVSGSVGPDIARLVHPDIATGDPSN